MIKSFKGLMVAGAMVAAGLTAPAVAQEEPVFKGGDWWQVTGVELMPGEGYNYAKHLASRWRDSMEFAKSKGWIKDYMVISNVHPRDGEPDMYLVEVFDEWVNDDKESEKRRKAWMEWSEANISEMEEAYGDRSSMRRIMGDSLLRQMEFRD